MPPTREVQSLNHQESPSNGIFYIVVIRIHVQCLEGKDSVVKHMKPVSTGVTQAKQTSLHTTVPAVSGR